MARIKKTTPTKVESIRHKDKRANIPTEELRDFVADDELAPKTMLYPRDPSLDPQLVWKGKDEQDRADLSVSVVPIYIQEKIHPQAIIDTLARTRLMAAKYPYYLLADSPEGAAKERKLSVGAQFIAPQAGVMNHAPTYDIKRGFVYKRVPPVTLKSIANNPDIKEGMTRQQIDAAIVRHAETETLYDQPYEDNKRVRVCGPLSVESLSPHRVLSVADEDQDGAVSEQEARKQQDFAMMILDKLKRALRAEIDEVAWSSLYSTVSRPFARPATGKIAVKVINHYGDEMLKVFEV